MLLPEKEKMYTNAYNSIIAITKNWKQPICLPTVEQINKLWCIDTMKYYANMQIYHPVLHG